ncbi:transposable element Tcb1 transposase [Trichonephila clavipes]|nr:transposable element Tcb1 transposase [Trichonephila clavipes]
MDVRLYYPNIVLEISNRVGRNQTTAMRICDRWMQRVRRTDVVDRIHFSASLHQSGLSVRRPLLVLNLTQNHRRLRRQWCDERRMWAAEWNEVVFTDEGRIWGLQHHDGRIRVWRHRGERMLSSCVMYRHIGPARGIMGLATAIFQQDDHTWHALSKGSSSMTRLNCFSLARSPDLSPIENMWSMVAQRLTHILPPAATPDQLVEAAWSAVPQEHIQSL